MYGDQNNLNQNNLNQNNLNQNNLNQNNLNQNNLNQNKEINQPLGNMNIINDNNIPNQNFNDISVKKTNVGLIIGIVAGIIVIIIGIIFGIKVFSNEGATNNNPSNTNNGANSNVEQWENNNTVENDDTKILTASTYFDTSKFDKSKYNGILYDSNGNSYKVSDFINNIGYNYDYNNQIWVTSYTFSSDYNSEKKAERSFDTYSNKIIEVLGQPSSYCEKYDEDDDGKMTGEFILVYDYDDYLITFIGIDASYYKYPEIVGSWIYKIDDFYSAHNYGARINEFTCYGKQLKRN